VEEDVGSDRALYFGDTRTVKKWKISSKEDENEVTKSESKQEGKSQGIEREGELACEFQG